MDKANICQLKSRTSARLFALLLILFSFSCTRLEVEDPPVVTSTPVWFNGPAQYQWMTPKGDIQLHPFYDMVPFSSAIDQSINFYPLFASNSSFFRDFDLVTGNTFNRFNFCPRADIWKKSDKLIKLPNFTYGIVPRLIDQLGGVQNILVFGNDSLYQSEVSSKIQLSHRVRVVGGTLHQYCEEYPCSTEEEWRSRLVLIAVDTTDPKFSKVRDWVGLKELVDWDYARVFLENLYGGTLTADLIKPAFRVTGEIDGKASLDAAIKKGHLFRFEELTMLRKSCHKLYDYVWENVEQLRNKEFKKPNFKNFADFFTNFYKRYGSEYRTCVSKVHNSTLNSSLKRFWFFVYFDGFFQQERMGYFFRCSEGVWTRNPLDPQTGKVVYDTTKLYSRCSTRQLDGAFESIPMSILGNANAGNPFLRFIEYDEGKVGTHDRLFTWTSFSGKKYLCQDKLRPDFMDVKDYDYFPKDIYWERFNTYNKHISIRAKAEKVIEE